LDRLDAAQEFRDMSYPGSGLYPLSGDKKGQYAVKISATGEYSLSSVTAMPCWLIMTTTTESD
jgi:plasmid maintenance system killer protein